MAKEAVRTISIKVNDVAPNKSINEIKKRIKELTKATDDVKEKNEQYYKDIAEIGQLKGALTKHRKQIKRISKGWDETKSKVDGYGKSFKNPLKEFLNFKNLTLIGLGTTLVSAAASFGAEMVEVSKEINKLRGDIQTLTGVTGVELENLTAKSTALSRVFQDESTDVIQTANSIANEFGISLDAALTLIEQGYLSGANAQGDFLEQLREYAPVAKEAKISAEDFTAQIVLASKSGEFSDYGQAAIEEALLRLRDMPKATEDAINAIGLSSKDIKRLIENEGVGAAIKTISSQLNEIEDDAPVMGQAVMGIFGASGEKVGVQYLKSLQEIGGNLDDMVDKSNDLTNQQLKQLEAEQELAAVQTQLSTEIQGLTTGTSVFVTQLKTGLLEIVIAIIRQFQNWITWGKELYENVGLVRFVVDQTAKNFRNFFNVLKATPQIANGVVESIKFIYRELQDFGANVVSNAKIAIQEAKNLVGRGDQSIIDAEKAAIQARNDGETIKDAFLKGFNSVKNNAPTDIPTVDNSTNGAPSQPTGGGRADFKPPVTSKTIDENAKNLERLKEQIAKFQDEQYLANLDANTKELEQIRKKYDEQIALAKKLNATDEVVALEELKNAELEKTHQKHLDAIEAAENAAFDKYLEKLDEEIDAEIEAEERKDELKEAKEQERQQRKRELREQIAFELMTDLEAELDALRTHYDNLILEAEQYGIDTTALKAKYKAEQLAIEQKHNKQEKKEQIQHQTAMSGSFNALAGAFGAMHDQMNENSRGFIIAQKAATLAAITFDTAAAISALTKNSEANPANAVTGGAAGIVQFIAGMARILSNIAQAKAVLTTQKKEGGFVEVIGKDDKKKYNAKRIGSPSTGMLPNQPVLLDSQVLASEAGQEYFVSNKSLQNPAIMDLVQTIDNIERQGVRQFQGGGSVNGSIGGGDSGLLQRTHDIMAQLLVALNNGVQMNVGFKEAEEIESLLNDYNKLK